MELNVILLLLYFIIGLCCLVYEWKTNIIKNYKDTIFDPCTQAASVIIYSFMIACAWPAYIFAQLYCKYYDNEDQLPR